MNILLRQAYPTRCGLELPRDFELAVEQGLDFKLAEEGSILEAIEKGPGSWEHDVWLPAIKEGIYRMIIHGLTVQLMGARKPFYEKWFNKIKRVVQ